MDTTDRIRQILADPASVDPSVLVELTKRYPYFAIPGILHLKYHADALDSRRTDALRLHLALCTGDRRALYDLVGEESAAFADIYPPEINPGPITTESAIDTFFATYGTSDSAENALLEKLIFNPTPDYSEILAREEQETSGGEDRPSGTLESCIDAFIRDHNSGADIAERHPRPAPQPEVISAPVTSPRPGSASRPADDSLLSESLAKIFIKQGRYERAYEIISNLSLNYPKKSIYFADQLRFLQKLIKIRQAAKRREDIHNSN